MSGAGELLQCDAEQEDTAPVVTKAPSSSHQSSPGLSSSHTSHQVTGLQWSWSRYHEYGQWQEWGSYRATKTGKGKNFEPCAMLHGIKGISKVLPVSICTCLQSTVVLVLSVSVLMLPRLMFHLISKVWNVLKVVSTILAYNNNFSESILTFSQLRTSSLMLESCVELSMQLPEIKVCWAVLSSRI